jgi:hypothetical protein
MRKYIDSVYVKDIDLAYTIASALEKDNKYSVDFFDDKYHGGMKDRPREVELKIFVNEKVVPTQVVGYDKEN